MKYDTVVFDLDGTLLYTLEDLTDSVNEALQAMNMPQRTIEEIRTFVGNGVGVLMKKSVPENTDGKTYDEAFSVFKKAYMRRSKNKTRVFDGIDELLDELMKKKVKIAIVSNKIDEAVKELNEYYFGGRIPVAVGDREGTARKPAPDLVEIALKELGSKKETTLYVGDSDVDIMTAENSGLDYLSVSWGFKTRDELIGYGAKTIVDKPKDILEFMDLGGF